MTIAGLGFLTLLGLPGQPVAVISSPGAPIFDEVSEAYRSGGEPKLDSGKYSSVSGETPFGRILLDEGAFGLADSRRVEDLLSRLRRNPGALTQYSSDPVLAKFNEGFLPPGSYSVLNYVRFTKGYVFSVDGRFVTGRIGFGDPSAPSPALPDVGSFPPPRVLSKPTSSPRKPGIQIVVCGAPTRDIASKLRGAALKFLDDVLKRSAETITSDLKGLIDPISLQAFQTEDLAKIDGGLKKGNPAAEALLNEALKTSPDADYFRKNRSRVSVAGRSISLWVHSAVREHGEVRRGAIEFVIWEE